MITICFTIEYLVRLYCADKPWRYARSFYGIVDLLAILPTYLSVLFPGAQSLLVIRGLGLLRVFRVLKLFHFVGYGIIAVPTGIVSVELAGVARKKAVTGRACPGCGAHGHDADATYCEFCGTEL